MQDHRIQRPNLFISHASSDAQFAQILETEIRKVFADGVDVFCTSSPGTIPPSADWLERIEQNLQKAQAVLVIVTPVSIERPWLWFEVGASWLRARSKEAAIYPLCVPEIDLNDLPRPLDRLEALSLGKAPHLKLLFVALIRQFGFGKISSFKASNITARIPKYNTVKVVPADVDERSLYSGEYTGYSDDELTEVIKSEYLNKEHHDRVEYGLLHKGREDNIYNGKLIHFRKVDRDLRLPPGTARRLLIPTAASYELEAEYEKDNVVRFRPTGEMKELLDAGY